MYSYFVVIYQSIMQTHWLQAKELSLCYWILFLFYPQFFQTTGWRWADFQDTSFSKLFLDKSCEACPL